MEARMGRWLGTISVDVEIRDILDDISDDDLLDECLERGLGDGSYDRDYAARALEALLAGRVGEAVALLDRSLYPTRITKDQWTASLFPKGRQISAAT